MIRGRLNTQPVSILPQQGLKRFYKQGDGGTPEQGPRLVEQSAEARLDLRQARQTDGLLC